LHFRQLDLSRSLKISIALLNPAIGHPIEAYFATGCRILSIVCSIVAAEDM